jgi:hypothetical protein
VAVLVELQHLAVLVLLEPLEPPTLVAVAVAAAQVAAVVLMAVLVAQEL